MHSHSPAPIVGLLILVAGSVACTASSDPPRLMSAEMIWAAGGTLYSAPDTLEGRPLAYGERVYAMDRSRKTVIGVTTASGARGYVPIKSVREPDLTTVLADVRPRLQRTDPAPLGAPILAGTLLVVSTIYRPHIGVATGLNEPEVWLPQQQLSLNPADIEAARHITRLRDLARLDPAQARELAETEPKASGALATVLKKTVATAGTR